MPAKQSRDREKFGVPLGCRQMYKKVTEFGELERECSNQIKSSISTQNINQDSQNKPNYLPWILGGVGVLGIIGVVRKRSDNNG